jgi:hypothetical protein
VLGTLAAVASSTPITSDQFAPGWQTDAKPLINMGVARIRDRNRWYVPGILPRGDYVLVQRDGDKAEVIDGYQFTVRSGNHDLYVYLMPGYSDVQALPIADVPAVKLLPGAHAIR